MVGLKRLINTFTANIHLCHIAIDIYIFFPFNLCTVLAQMIKYVFYWDNVGVLNDSVIKDLFGTGWQTFPVSWSTKNKSEQGKNHWIMDSFCLNLHQWILSSLKNEVSVILKWFANSGWLFWIFSVKVFWIML